ncbi:PH domain-containing protein [Pseudoclavibacter helvolus]|uniref:PH domain-containing protein n=1 Tax=Pseudoclavibacter helvolus TaxID=255205 RepID=UPI0024AD6106|nr:PH domain-containing protein [Pseudoclavibacter helvolus]
MATKQKLLELASQHLEASELILASVVGTYDSKIAGQDTLRSGLLLATDLRVMFYAKKLGGFEIESFPYRNISSFEHGKSLMGHHVSLYASGNRVVVKWLQPAQDFEPFLAEVKAKMHQKAADIANVSASGTANYLPEDIYAALEKLGQLRDAGVLTEDEFSAKKTELLARI